MSAAVFEGVERIEAERRSRVLVFASSQLEIDMLPPLYEALCDIGPCERLDVLFYSRGGIVNAARRIALLFREFAPRVAFLVPHYCESAGTVAALSADEIVAGPLAVFSPIDPILSAAQPGRNGPLALSAQDVRLFGEMATRWFGLQAEDAKAQALSALAGSVFPTTLTSFYRTTLEVEEICAELIGLHMGAEHAEKKRAIAQQLIYGYHSHTYALTRGELARMGLPVREDRKVEQLMWPVVRELRSVVGPAARQAVEDDWLDAFVGTRDGAKVRRRSDALPGMWQDWR